jgi:tubby-related protein 1
MCNITRKNSGIDKLYPKYYCTVLKSEKFLMGARKRPNNTTANYLITMSFDNFEKNSEGFLGKLRSNFMGTEFSIYDTGKNPSEAKNGNEIRKQLAQITYESNFFGMNGPRKMKVYIPNVDPNTREVCTSRPKSVMICLPQDSENLISKYENGDKKVLELCNKQPVWSESTLNHNFRT